MAENKQAVPAENQAMVLTPETLKLLIEEIRKPIVTDKEKRELDAAQQDRQANAGMQKQMALDKKASQKICTHTHKTGATHCVFVQNGNFILCQKCQDVIRPEDRLELFNELFQACQTELFG